MNYLLSSGKVTTDKYIYIKDLIRLNLLIRKQEVPYWKGGSDEFINIVSEIQVKNQITAMMNDLITKIGSQFKEVAMSLSSIDITQLNVLIKIKIDDLEESYDIKRNY